MKPIALVVEDEPAIAELVRYNLEKEDFTVETAEDGEEALIRIEELRPDVVVLDWMLPTFPAWRSAAGCGANLKPEACRSSFSPRAARKRTRCGGWTAVPTTMW